MVASRGGRIGPRWAIWALAGAVAGGCTEEGSVRVILDTPASESLTPFDERLASLTLVVEADGQSRRQTREAQGEAGPLSFGDLPVAEGVELGLIALGASSQLLGFGHTADPVNVRPDEQVDVTIRVRKPYAYVAGATRLLAFDTTESEDALPASIDVGAGSPAALATTADGADLVIVAGNAILLASTATHARDEAFPQVTLSPGASGLALSPGARQAVVLHTGSPVGISIVDLEAARTSPETTSATFVPLAGASAVTATDAHAYVLVDGTSSCTGTSNLKVVSLAAPDETREVALGFPARDLAISSAQEQVALAAPCRGLVFWQLSDDTVAREVALPAGARASAVALGGGRAWVLGRTATANDAHLVLGSVGLSGGEATFVDLATTSEVVAFQLDMAPGQSIDFDVTLQADEADAPALAVLPDGGRVAALVTLRYHGDAREVCLDEFCLLVYDQPEVDVLAEEIWLIDPALGTVVQRTQARCEIREEAAATRACDSRGAQAQYTPTGLAVLYEGR